VSRNASDSSTRLRNISESRDCRSFDTVEPTESSDGRQQNGSESLKTRPKDAEDRTEKTIKEKSENSADSLGVEQRLDQLARFVKLLFCYRKADVVAFYPVETDPVVASGW
jgi:hypothetical protein